MTQVKAAPKKPYKKPKEDHPLVVIAVVLGIILFSCNNMKSEQEAAIAQAEKCNRSDAWLEKWYDSDCVQNPKLKSERLYSGSRLFFKVK